MQVDQPAQIIKNEEPSHQDVQKESFEEHQQQQNPEKALKARKSSLSWQVSYNNDHGFTVMQLKHSSQEAGPFEQPKEKQEEIKQTAPQVEQQGQIDKKLPQEEQSAKEQMVDTANKDVQNTNLKSENIELPNNVQAVHNQIQQANNHEQVKQEQPQAQVKEPSDAVLAPQPLNQTVEEAEVVEDQTGNPYVINIHHAPQQKFIAFQEFPQQQTMYWEVFYMKSDFEINPRKKYQNLQEIERVIEEERKRLELLKNQQELLQPPQVEVIEDHCVEREANSEGSEHCLNKTMQEEFHMEMPKKRFDTEQDEEANEIKQKKATMELQAFQANRGGQVARPANETGFKSSTKELAVGQIITKTEKQPSKEKTENKSKDVLLNEQNKEIVAQEHNEEAKNVHFEEAPAQDPNRLRNEAKSRKSHKSVTIKHEERDFIEEPEEHKQIVDLVNNHTELIKQPELARNQEVLKGDEPKEDPITNQQQTQIKQQTVKSQKQVNRSIKQKTEESIKLEKQKTQRQLTEKDHTQQQHKSQVVEKQKTEKQATEKPAKTEKQLTENSKKENQKVQNISESKKQRSIMEPQPENTQNPHSEHPQTKTQINEQEEVQKDQQQSNREQEPYKLQKAKSEISKKHQKESAQQKSQITPLELQNPHTQNQAIIQNPPQNTISHADNVDQSVKSYNKKQQEAIKDKTQKSLHQVPKESQMHNSENQQQQPMEQKVPPIKIPQFEQRSQSFIDGTENGHTARASQRSKKSRSSRASSIQKRLQGYKFTSNVLNVTVEGQKVEEKEEKNSTLKNWQTARAFAFSKKMSAQEVSTPNEEPNNAENVENVQQLTKSQKDEENPKNQKQNLQSQKISEVDQEKPNSEHKPQEVHQSSQKIEDGEKTANQQPDQKLPAQLQQQSEYHSELIPQNNLPLKETTSKQLLSVKQIQPEATKQKTEFIEKQAQEKHEVKIAEKRPKTPKKLSPIVEAGNIPTMTPKADPQKQALKEEIKQLRKTIIEIRNDLVKQRSKSNLIKIDNPNQPSSKLERPLEVSRTQSIMEYYERNKMQMQYPDINDIKTDHESSPQPKLFWHTEKRKPNEKAGKILHRRLSEKKALDLSGTERQDFRIRPFISKIASKEETTENRLSVSYLEASKTTPIKKKVSKEELLHKINVNQHNFRRFVRTKSNLVVQQGNPAKEQSKKYVDLFSSDALNVSFPKQPGKLKQSNSNLASSAEKQTMKNSFVKPKSPKRSPLPNDNSFHERYKQEQLEKIPVEPITSSAAPILNPLMSHKQKSQAGNISRIEDEPSQNIIQENEDRFLDFPTLPPTPNATMNSQELIQLGRETFQLFGLPIYEDMILNIKKYRNCVYFNAEDRHILWHYTGKFYIGGWNMNCKASEGEKSGDGIQFVPQKYVYEGQFKEGKRHGQGTMRSNFNDVYTGQWSKGLRHGHGILKESNGLIYEGQWKEGKKHGFGKEVIADNDMYEGGFQNGLKCGLGKQTFPNGDKYQGNYAMNKFNGKGTYWWADSSYYIGQFQNNLRHGKGIWKSNMDRGDTYQGEYKNDKKCGQGKYTWQNGVVYTGAFENDLRHGQGIIKDDKGNCHRAIWENGLMKNKLFLEEQPKLKEQKTAKRISLDVKKKIGKPEGQDPLQKRRSSVVASSLSKIAQSTSQLSKLASSLREQPYRNIQEPRLLVQNI